jgi:triacylglycerol lipase
MSNPLGFFDLIQEFGAVGEFARFANTAWTWRLTPRTQRPRVILLIPGFMAGDVTLYPFANWLRSRGHQVFFSGILANADCPRRAMDRLAGILQKQYERYDEKVVIIGHSLGGIYARELARRMPQYVEQIILLGSPVREPGLHSHPLVKLMGSLTMRMHEMTGRCTCETDENICGVNLATPPPGVPESILFSKSDGVVNWVSCLESGPDVRTFEVKSTHCGLPYNLETLRIVHDLLESGSDDRDLPRTRPIGRVAATASRG